MRKTSVILLAVVSVLLCLAAVAQEPMGPPKVLSIIREEVKVGKGAAHEKWEAAWMQAEVRAKYPTSYLAMTAATGANEAWYLFGFDSFAAWEKDAKLSETPPFMAVSQHYGAGDAEYVSNTRNVVALYRPDLSYRANIKVGEMRYFAVRTVRVRPGHDNEYVEIRKLVNAARTKASVDDHNAVYQVVSGAPNGTYLVFTPRKSMAEADAPPNPAMADALGDDGRAKLNDLVGKAILGSEDTLFAFSPKMSHPSADMIAADPAYWTPKPAAATKETAAGGKKPAAAPAGKQKPAGN